MAQFAIYSYLFSPVYDNQLSLPIDGVKEVDVNESVLHKQDIFGDVLGDGQLHFHQGKTEYKHRMCLHSGGIYALRLANNRKTNLENDFNIVKIDNHPSATILVDNRHDRQVIAIEKNAAFASADKVAAILSDTLRRRLLPSRLSVEVCRKCHTDKLLQAVELTMQGNVIEHLEFTIPYPNLPVISDLVGQSFGELAKATHSNLEVGLNGQNGSVVLDKNDQKLLDLIKAGAATGRPVVIKYKGSRQKHKIEVESNVEETLDDRVLNRLDDRDLFDSKYHAVVEFMNGIKLMYD